MAATDYLTAVYSKLRALLEGHAPYTSAVKIGNRIYMDGDKIDPFKNAMQDSDFPQAALFMGDLTDSMFSLEQQYAYRGVTAQNAVWTEDLTPVYQLAITHPDLRMAPANLLTLEAMTAIRKGGPRLGLEYVQLVGPIRATRTIVTNERDEGGNPTGRRRLRTDITIPVLIRLKGHQLIT